MPPSGALDVVVSAAGLSMLAVVAIVGVIYGYAQFGRTLRTARRRSVLVGGAVIAGGFAAFAAEAAGYDLPTPNVASFDPEALGVLALALVVLVLAGVVMDVRRLSVAVAVALLAWGTSWLVALTITANASYAPQLTDLGFTLCFAFGYPLGVALRGEEPRTRDQSLAAVGLLMVGAVVAAMSRFVPLPGGPAVLVIPGAAGLVAVLLVASAPAVAAGARSTQARGLTIGARTD